MITQTGVEITELGLKGRENNYVSKLLTSYLLSKKNKLINRRTPQRVHEEHMYYCLLAWTKAGLGQSNM